jgi:hypothetical protein
MTDAARDIEFEHTLIGWVRVAFARGVRSFPDLVAVLPGAYPADVARVIDRLKDELPFAWSDGHAPALRRASTSAGWPVEHPLDFDWRFTPEAARLLLDRCGTDLTAAFLGAPSLAREAAERSRRGAVRLFDRNPSVAAAARKASPGITVTCVDLLWDEPVDPGDAAVSVADPPWYPEHTAAFLWAAARLTRVGGIVLLSLPPEGTRPGISAEREAILATATSFGLKLVSLEPGVLAYRMPPFERNALVAAGVAPVSADWRHGDLASFTVVGKSGVPRPPAPGEPDGWDEESVGSVRIKCRKCPVSEFRDPTLSHLVPGDMLTSVSRRHPARAAVDVWTSGNRVFRCLSPSLFRVILSALARGHDAEEAVSLMLTRRLGPEEVALVRRAVTQAVDLVRREEWELAEYGHQCHERDLVEAV